MNPRGAYASGTTYAQFDGVTSAGVAYISLSSGNIGHTPSSSPTFWESVGSSGVTDPGTNGVMKRTALNTTAPALADDLSAPLYAAASSGTNAIVATLSPNITAYVTGTRYRIRAFGSNTGQTTINLNGLGAIVIKKLVAGSQLDMVAGDIVVGQMLELTYDGAVMQLLSPSQWSSSGATVSYSAGSVGIGTASPQALLNVKKASAGFAPLAGSTQLFIENSGAAAYVETACASASDSCGYLFSSGSSLTSYIIDLSGTWSFVSTRPAVWNIGGAERVRITTAGRIGIGTAVPTAPLHVVGLTTFANNSAAISGGLTAGAFYTDGAGSVKVVF